MVPAVNNVSTVAEAVANPTLELTKPNVINTSGEISMTTRNHGDENLLSLFAQIALTEFAVTATKTDAKIYAQVVRLFMGTYTIEGSTIAESKSKARDYRTV